METTINENFTNAKVTDLDLVNLKDRGMQFCGISSNLSNKLGLEPRDADALICVKGNGGETVLRMTIFRQEQDIIALDEIVMQGIDAPIGNNVKIRVLDYEEIIQPSLVNVQIVAIFNQEHNQKIELERADDLIWDLQDEIEKRLDGLTFADGNYYECAIEELLIKIKLTSKNKYFMLGEDTKLKFTIKRSNIDDITWDDIGGLKKEIEQIRERVELPIKYPELFKVMNLKAPKGILLYGPPGTGKTLMGKAQASTIGLYSVFIDSAKVISKFYGESEENLEKFFMEAYENKPSMIFIDEIDSLAPKRGRESGSLESRIVTKLQTLMDGVHNTDGITVIGATNRPEILDPALRRPGRFDIEIEIGVPDVEGRMEIFEIQLKDTPLAENISIEELSHMTHGFVGADIFGVVNKAKYSAIRKAVPDIDEDVEITSELLNQLQLTQEEIKDAVKQSDPSALRDFFVEVPDVKWEDIGGLETEIALIKESITLPLQKPELFKKLGITSPSGILLYGAPGCGKTLLAKAVATEGEANFISVKGPELITKWVGESEKAVRQLFSRARQVAPCVTGDCEVVLSNGRCIKIEDIYNSNLKDFSILSMNDKMKIEVEKPIAITRREAPPIFNINTVSNHRISATGNHLFPVLENGVIRWKRADMLTDNDYVGIPNIVVDEGKVMPMNRYLDKETRIYDEHLFYNNLDAKTRNKMRYRKARKPYVKLSEIRNNITLDQYNHFAVGKGGYKDSTITKMPSHINTDIAYLLGLIDSDGNMSKDGRRFSFINTSMELHKKFKDIIMNNFNLEVGFYRMNKKDYGNKFVNFDNCKPCYSTKVSNKMLFDIINNIRADLLSFTPNLLYAWLSGYIDGDGSIRISKKKYPQIIISSNDKNMKKIIKKILQRLGIIAKFTEYNLVITNLKDIRKLKENLRLFHPKKRDRLQKIKVSKNDYNRIYKFPVGNLLSKARKSINMTKQDFSIPSSAIYSYEKNDRHPNLYRLRKIYRDMIKFCTKHNRDVTEEIERIHILINSDMNWVKIRSVENGLKPDYVYDICCEKNHNFVANGMLIHNCVIFFDEIDALARTRGVISTDAGVNDKVIAQLLTEMEGIVKNSDVITIMATNRPDQLDPALMRAGRIDRFIPVNPPNKEARKKIFEIHTKGMKLCKAIQNDAFLEEMAEATDGYSGADIELVCREAGMHAIRRPNVKCINENDFQYAVEHSGASITEEMTNFYDKMTETLRTTKRNKKDAPWSTEDMYR